MLLQSSGQRRISEILLPASVILAGVLVVVAFAFINRATRDDEADVGVLLPQPPALGEVPLAPTGGPLPSLSPTSPSPSPSPSASASATTTTPPARRTTPPPANRVDVDRAGVPDTVDLSGEGRLDWVHWGEQSTFSLERDAGGDFRILEGAPTAPRQRHQLSPQRFRWSGGAPVARSDGTRVGINTCGEDNGFTLSAPASRTERTLRLYVGAVQSRGRLEARLSTGGGTHVGKLERQGDGMATAVFVVRYRAARDGRLDLSWNTEEAFGSGCAGVALQAATLS